MITVIFSCLAIDEHP